MYERQPMKTANKPNPSEQDIFAASAKIRSLDRSGMAMTSLANVPRPGGNRVSITFELELKASRNGSRVPSNMRVMASGLIRVNPTIRFWNAHPFNQTKIKPDQTKSG